MTPEQRITQMEKLLETTIKLTHSNTQKINDLTELTRSNTQKINDLTELTRNNTQKIDANAEAISNLTNRVDTVSQQMGELTTIFIDSMAVIRQMQSEIRGLQIENRRIIGRVFEDDIE